MLRIKILNLEQPEKKKKAWVGMNFGVYEMGVDSL